MKIKWRYWKKREFVGCVYEEDIDYLNVERRDFVVWMGVLNGIIKYFIKMKELKFFYKEFLDL